MMSIARRAFLGAAGCAATGLIALGWTGPARAETVEWSGYTYTLPVMEPYKGLDRIVERIGKESEGRLAIELSPGGSLPINGNDIAQAIGTGVIDFGATGGYAGYIPIGGIGRLPMLYGTIEEFENAYKVLKPYLSKAMEEKGLVLLGHYRYPVQVIWGREPVTSLADLKGAKVRVVSPEQAEAVQRLGAAPVTIATPDVAPALQRGTIDMLLTASAGGGKLWHDMLTHSYRLGVNWSLSLILANKDRFEALPQDLQDRLLRISEEEGARISQTLLEEEDQLTADYAKQGLIVTEARPEDLKLAQGIMKAYWDDWAKQHSADAQEALSKIRAELGR